MPSRQDHERFSIFALRHPTETKVEFFFARALPFGAKAAVHGFNRASRAINYLVHAYGGVTTGTYFDDFPMVAPEQVSRNMYKRMIQIMTILGWALKKKKGSLEWPRNQFQCLGVQIVFDKLLVTKVQNVQSRIEKIKEIFRGMEQARVIGEQELASLRGKMQFSNAQVYGRIGARAFHVLNKATQPIPGYAWRGSEVEEAIRWWIQTVDRMPPRTLDHKDRRLPVRIFTDGACEGEASESTTYGAVLFDPEDGSVEAFGAEMCEELKSLLSEEGKKTQLIQAKTLILIFL